MVHSSMVSIARVSDVTGTGSSIAATIASKNPDAANAIAAGGQAAAIQGQLNFSRDMEREADRIGFAVLGQAGFDPSGFASMFDKLQKASRLNDYGAFPYLGSHPLTTERLADMASRDLGGARTVQGDGGDLEHQMVAARARASVPTAPRKYFVVTMVEALTDQKSGYSTPRCSKTVSPVFQFCWTTSRRSQVIAS